MIAASSLMLGIPSTRYILNWITNPIPRWKYLIWKYIISRIYVNHTFGNYNFLTIKGRFIDYQHFEVHNSDYELYDKFIGAWSVFEKTVNGYNSNEERLLHDNEFSNYIFPIYNHFMIPEELVDSEHQIHTLRVRIYGESEVPYKGEFGNKYIKMKIEII